MVTTSRSPWGDLLRPGWTRLQRQFGNALQAKVAGPQAKAAHDRIWGTPGPRWFTPSDPIWRVHAHASMFAGGVASLLLQSAHPLAMSAVHQHSAYREDPWGRLQRTSTFLATTTFGTVDHAEQMIRAIRTIHSRISGVSATGSPYRADDPHLLTWVHCAEISMFLRAYQEFSGTPLSTSEADVYVAQAGTTATKLGAENVPQTVAELWLTLDAYRRELTVTPEAREAAGFLLTTPPLPYPVRIGYDAITWSGLQLLTPWLRSEFRSQLPWWTRVLPRSVYGDVGTAVTASVGWMVAGAHL